MRIRFKVAARLVVMGCLVLAVALPASAEVNMYDGNWHYTVAPYVWVPSINATLVFSGVPGAGAGGVPGSVNVMIGPNAYLSSFNFGFLGYFEARNSDWSIFADTIYLNLSNQGASVVTLGSGPVSISLNVSTNAAFETFLGTLALSRTIAHTDTATLDVFAGVRYLQGQTTVNWSLTGPIGAFPISGSATRSQNLLDGIVGVKGRLELGRDSHWFVPYYLDAGAGAFTTWQAVVGIGYAFSWGDVVLDTRYMYIDNPQSGLQNMTLSGPMLGVAFHW